MERHALVLGRIRVEVDDLVDECRRTASVSRHSGSVPVSASAMSISASSIASRDPIGLLDAIGQRVAAFLGRGVPLEDVSRPGSAAWRQRRPQIVGNVVERAAHAVSTSEPIRSSIRLNSVPSSSIGIAGCRGWGRASSSAPGVARCARTVLASRAERRRGVERVSSSAAGGGRNQDTAPITTSASERNRSSSASRSRELRPTCTTVPSQRRREATSSTIEGGRRSAPRGTLLAVVMAGCPERRDVGVRSNRQEDGERATEVPRANHAHQQARP